jgi:hopanoid biosynthesis associated RND transporter like protein HpnN
MILRIRRRYLAGLVTVVTRWPAWLVFGAVALAVVSVVYTVRNLEFRTSRNDLIGTDSEYWRLFSEYAHEFGAEEDYLIVVEGAQPSRNRAAVDALMEALLSPANNPHPHDHPEAQLFTPLDVYARTDLGAITPWFLYYLSVEELEEIGDSLKEFKQLVAILQRDPRLETFLDAMNQMLEQMAIADEARRRNMEAFLPTVGAIVEQLADYRPDGEEAGLLSPWARAFFSKEMLEEAEQQFRWDGYHVFDGGRMFVLLIHPLDRPHEHPPEPHAPTIRKLRRIIEQVRPAFPELNISLTGEPVLDHDEMEVSERDARRATLVTLALIAALFAVSFHEVLRPVLATCCLVLIVALSLGFATLAIGHLNIITITFTVMILGLGIDLGIQLLARYEEELSRGAAREQAVSTAIQMAGRSIITAGLTNAAAFFAMGLSGFRGVIELGIIAGGGMLIATVVTLLVLPSLLLRVRRQREDSRIPAQVTATRFERFLLRRAYTVLAACGAVTAGALLLGWQVRFDFNVLNLQSRGLESVETELRLLQADAQSTIFAAVVTSDLDATGRLHEQLEKLPSVGSVVSIASLVPRQQERKSQIIGQIKDELGEVGFDLEAAAPDDAAAVLSRLRALRLRARRLAQIAAETGQPASAALLGRFDGQLGRAVEALQAMDAEAVSGLLGSYRRRFYADLQAQLELMAGQEVEERLTPEQLPPEVRRMLVGKSGRFLLRVFPKENIWERDALAAFVRDIRSVAPAATGTPLGLYEFVGILQRGYRNAALWALAVIVAVVFLNFRSVTATALTVLPLAVGFVWMFGAMVLPRALARAARMLGWDDLAGMIGPLEVTFNPANIMVLPLLVGIGIAYGIYVVQRYTEDHDAEFYRKSTGRAVLLSALTTIVAFGSLTLGHHRGIQSLGIVMMVGIASCLIAALVLLPSLLEVARRRGWRI